MSHYTMLSKYGNCTRVLKIKTSWKSVVFTVKVRKNSRYFVSVLNKTIIPLALVVFEMIKVARYSFSRPIPPKFEHKLRRHKQSFGKIAPTVVLDKDENLLWSGLQWHRSCHSNEMTLLPILLTEVFLGTENCSSKIIHGSFFLQ